MFARVFDTAKRLISRSPSVQGRSSEITDSPSQSDEQQADSTMVTTRGGTETPGAATPLSSVKKRPGKRELEALETPTQTKRQRKAAPAAKRKATQKPSGQDELAGDLLDTIAVAIPSSDATGKEEELPIRRRTGAKASPPTSTAADTVEEQDENNASVTTEDAEIHTPEPMSDSVYATPATHKRVEESPTPKAKATKDRTPASAKRSSARKQKIQKEEPNTLEVSQITSKFLDVDEVPSSTLETEQDSVPSQNTTEASLSQPQKAHFRFGSEEAAEVETQIGYEATSTTQADPELETQQEDDDDGASDSDEAPEVITTAAATSKAQAAQAETDRALRAKQAEEQAKRQRRDERIAEEQAQKRIREEKKAKKLAKQIAKQQLAAGISEDEEEASASHLDSLRDTNSLPALLPDSLLSTIDDQRPPTPPLQRRGKTEEELRKEKLNHHIKFLERSEKPSKDIKKGKLSVAVLGQQKKVLPPKVNRNTRNVRELWLKGRQVEKKKGGKPKFRNTKMERRPHGARGFLRGGDD